MQQATVNSLITSRVLFKNAKNLIAASTNHSCSAGLIILQDSIEIIVLACLLEKNDDGRDYSKKSFDELLGELKKVELPTKNATKLKAMNKQRVLAKHLGELVEPTTALGFLHACEEFADALVISTTGKRLEEIFLLDLLIESEAKLFLVKAHIELQKGGIESSLVEIRKAIFVELEHNYSIYGWKDVDGATGLMAFLKGGAKAPYWTKNKKWIDKNIKSPLHYIQIDYDRLKRDALEWGVSTVDLENIRRLTPEVFRIDKDSDWAIKTEMAHNYKDDVIGARYCLNAAIDVIFRIQQHSRRIKRQKYSTDNTVLDDEFSGANVYENASTDSEIVGTVDTPSDFDVYSKENGFNCLEEYYWVAKRPSPSELDDPSDWVGCSGYVHANV